MSIFKSSGVVLKIHKLGNKDFIYDVFTLEYGKIKVAKKISSREKALDLGYIVNFEIITKQKKDIHKIRNIKTKYEFLNKKRSFKQINNYLTLLSIISKKIPDRVNVPEIYNICENINKIEKDLETNLILSSLKIIDIAGDLKIEHKNKTVEKILKFIHINKIEKILKLTGIDKNILKELELVLNNKGL